MTKKTEKKSYVTPYYLALSKHQ